jgi:hemerythrin
MALLNWTTEYSVEVDSIDRQHQKLFLMLNQLHDAMRVGKGAELAPSILVELLRYTREHFADEERMLIQARYPDFARHKAEHKKLNSEVAQMVQDIENGKAVLSMDLVEFLRTWLQEHILGRDKKYMTYL